MLLLTKDSQRFSSLSSPDGLIKQVPAVSDCPWQDSLTVYVPKVPAEGRGVGTLLYNTTSTMGTTVFNI